MKVAIITPYVIPRRISFYNTVSKLAKLKGLEIVFFIVKEKPVHRSHENYTNHFEFDYVLLNALQLYVKQSELAIDVPWDLYKQLKTYRPDIIITEGIGVAYIPAYLCAYIKKIPLICWNKSSSFSSSRAITGTKFWIKKILFKYYKYFISGGEGQSEYLLKHGVPKLRIAEYTDTIDTSQFRLEGESRDNTSKVVKIIFIGELIFRKGLDRVFKAISELQLDIEITIIGRGVEEAALKKLATKLNFNVKFLGYYDPQLIPRELERHDLCIVPSRREAWGIVVEEALSSGLYVVADKNVGAAERIIYRENGSYFESEDELRRELQFAVSEIHMIRKWRNKRAKDFCERFNINTAAESFVENIQKFDG